MIGTNSAWWTGIGPRLWQARYALAALLLLVGLVMGLGVLGAWLEARKSSKPLCLLVGTNWPHVPWPEQTSYDPNSMDLPATHVDTPETRLARARYGAAVANADRDLGLIYDAVRRQLGDDTLFIFMNDNGGTAGVKVYNAGMHGGKGTPYRGGTRASSFWRWPEVLKPGVDVNKLTAHIDIFPTLAEIAGAKIPDGLQLDGRSLVPLLKDAGAPWGSAWRSRS